MIKCFSKLLSRELIDQLNTEIFMKKDKVLADLDFLK